MGRETYNLFKSEKEKPVSTNLEYIKDEMCWDNVSWRADGCWRKRNEELSSKKRKVYNRKSLYKSPRKLKKRTVNWVLTEFICVFFPPKHSANWTFPIFHCLLSIGPRKIKHWKDASKYYISL